LHEKMAQRTGCQLLVVLLGCRRPAPLRAVGSSIAVVRGWRGTSNSIAARRRAKATPTPVLSLRAGVMAVTMFSLTEAGRL